MFTLRLGLNRGECVQVQPGIASLDWLRRHGFPDGDRVPMATDNFQRTVQVSETFARLYFEGKCDYAQVIPLQMLSPGELVIDTEAFGGSRLAIASTISEERAKELFIAAKASEEIARLKRRIASLEESLRELQEDNPSV